MSETTISSEKTDSGSTKSGTSDSGLLADALMPVASDLARLQPLLKSYIKANSQTTKSVLEHVFSSTGKLVRPAIYYYCARMMGYSGEHLDPIAAVCEYVHTASLLHDDVVDNSTLRRNKPSSNSIWGDEASVLVGDLIYSRASEMMAESGSLELVHCFARAIRLMSEGELIQLENVFNIDITESTYFAIVEYKTAVLISACCKAAGLLAKNGEVSEIANALEAFGRNIGIAFQLVDDALDYQSSNEKTGKPTLNDLLEGKVTLPIILLREHMSSDEKTQLEEYAKKGFGSEGVDFAAQLVQKYHTVSQTLEAAKKYTDEAVAKLDSLGPSESKDQLIALCHQLVWRHY